MPTGGWNPEWIIHGRPVNEGPFGVDTAASDHSSSYDGGGDSLTNSDSSSDEMPSPPPPPLPLSPESELDPCDICACCYSYGKGMPVCSDCHNSNCFSNVCSKACVACKREVCNACLGRETKLCPTCIKLFEWRDIAHFIKERSLPASPLAFQKVLDRISEVMGLDPEYESRGEDGLERWPPLQPLPKHLPPGQAVIDAYVRPALLLVPPGAKFLSDKPLQQPASHPAHCLHRQ